MDFLVSLDFGKYPADVPQLGETFLSSKQQDYQANIAEHSSGKRA